MRVPLQTHPDLNLQVALHQLACRTRRWRRPRPGRGACEFRSHCNSAENAFSATLLPIEVPTYKHEPFHPRPPQCISPVPKTASPVRPPEPSSPTETWCPDSVPSRATPAPQKGNPPVVICFSQSAARSKSRRQARRFFSFFLSINACCQTERSVDSRSADIERA